MNRRYSATTASVMLTSALTSAWVAACGIEGPTTIRDPNTVAIDETGQGVQPLIAHDQWIWTEREIPVCFENRFDDTSEERAWVKAAIERTWQQVSRIEFTGWGECSWWSPGVRIAIRDENPYVLWPGAGLSGWPAGMVLNFDFVDWAPVCLGSSRKFCIETIAVHEFGHALGFAHEQNHPDSPPWCKGDSGFWLDRLLLGLRVASPWDLDSVMNYCNPDWAGGGSLSPGDIEGMQAVYGAPTSCRDGRSACEPAADVLPPSQDGGSGE